MKPVLDYGSLLVSVSGVVPQSEPAARDTTGGRPETSATDAPQDQATMSAGVT